MNYIIALLGLANLLLLALLITLFYVTQLPLDIGEDFSDTGVNCIDDCLDSFNTEE